MKLLITREWLQRKLKEDEEAGVEEPYCIGPPGRSWTSCLPQVPTVRSAAWN